MSAAEMHDLDVFHCPLDGIHLIEASAGTGKTWNLCGLYLRLLLEAGFEVQQVLVVTFTRAATAELKARIRARIVEVKNRLGGAAGGSDPFVDRLLAALEARGHAPATLRARLDVALQAFDEAAIFTIHGYCQRALAETPFAAGLPFALELGEDDLELRLEVTRDFWRRQIASDHCSAELGALLIARGDSPERWAELLRRCQARPMAERRWPDPAAGGSADPAALGSAFAEAVRQWESGGEDATGLLLDSLGQLNANSYKAESVQAAAQAWGAYLRGADPLVPVKGLRLELFSAATLEARTKRNATTPRHAFYDAAGRFLDVQAETVAQLEHERLCLLRRFIEESLERLRTLKRERRTIAFDDILFNVHRALAGGRNPWLAGELHRRYPAALIDEFQDTDPLQFDIFRRIYAEDGRHGHLFLVGDPKQAIYSFRNADLQTYLDARRHADRAWTLRENQRSAAGLIRACNRLFEANPQAFVLDGLEFAAVREGERPRQRFVDESGTGAAPLSVWWLPENEEGEPPMRADALARATAATASEIARLLREGAAGRIRLDDRGLRAGDIAVLVRSHRQGTRVREALAALGVGSVELSQASVFHSAEAEELERVLIAIEEPSRQPLLFAALATTLMGFEATALDALAADDGALMERLGDFMRWREAWQVRGCGVMLREWIADAGVMRRLLSWADGERRLTNLLHLAECLHEAAATHPSPDALLRWFASRRAEPSAGEAGLLRLESDRNLVQIVTVHRAKGLEYGIVFCPFLFDGYPSPGDDGEGAVYHDEPGDAGQPRLVLDFRPEARADKEVKARQRRERDAEQLRLIYVALTRAVHRCVLVAGCYRRAHGRNVSATESVRSLLNWLVAGRDMTHAQWTEAKPGPDDIRSAWERLQQGACADISLGELPEPVGERFEPTALPADSLQALPPQRVPAGWRIGSFSALSHGATREEAARDHDARGDGGGTPTIDPQLSLPEDAPPADDILHFPRGPLAGDCVHAVFERVDFVDAATREPAIERALAEHPQRAGNLAPDEARQRHRRMLGGMLANVLATPLPDGIVLNTVARSRRLVELGFHLPVPQLSSEALNDWLARHGYAGPRLGFAPLSGYLKGYIDLVFEHGGRFYLLDWKSNHLGYAADDYAPDRLEAAMRDHGYHLQHLLYSVALHRHLRRSLPDYDFETRFGGVLYLFVRGVRPAWQAGGRATGVYFHRVEAEVLDGLDRLVGDGAAAGEGGR